MIEYPFCIAYNYYYMKNTSLAMKFNLYLALGVNETQKNGSERKR